MYNDVRVFFLQHTNLFGAAAFAGLRVETWHGDGRRGGLGVLGVGFGRTVTRLSGGRGGCDLHSLAAFH